MPEDCEPAGEQKATPWGFWATTGFSCIIAIVYVFVQLILFIVFAVVAALSTQNFDIEAFADGLQTNGFFLSTAILATAPFTIGLVILFAKIRPPLRPAAQGEAASRSITLKEYLCLNKVGWKEIRVWLLIVLLGAGIFDTLTYFLGRSIVTKFMLDTYTTAYFVPFLWAALIIVAPIVEEVFFRGFMFKGIEHSVLGPAGAVIITALLWSVMHVQYDVYGIISLFILGLILGIARHKSKSIYPTIVMHILQNLIATVEVVIYLRVAPNAA